jgi:hypothetical protein
MENTTKWNVVSKVFGALYKCAVVALLAVAVWLLQDIRSRQQTFPTFGDMRKTAPRDRLRLAEQAPLVHVDGGVTVDGSVQIERQ